MRRLRKKVSVCYLSNLSYIFVVVLFSILSISYAYAAKINAEDVEKFEVENLGRFEINIDADLADWALVRNALVMGGATWEPNGGSWDDDDDLTAELRILYDEDNLYFGLLAMDDEYVAQGANPWDNDGVQIAIDTSAGVIPAGWPNATTHLYNFSIANGWQMETGPFLGNAEIEMKRDDSKKQTIFEWCMPSNIVGKNIEFVTDMEIAFAIIVNDSDKNAPGQKGWVGWGNHTIVWGKNPEEMKTLVLTDKMMAVESPGKLVTTWGIVKY